MAHSGDLSIDILGLGRASFLGGLELVLSLHLLLVVDLSLGLSLGFEGLDDSLVLPAGLGGESADWSVLAVGLQLDLLVGRWDDDALALVVWGRDTFKDLNRLLRVYDASGVNLKRIEGSLTAGGLVGKHASDDVLEHLRGRSTVEGPSRRLGKMSLLEVVEDLNCRQRLLTEWQFTLSLFR